MYYAIVHIPTGTYIYVRKRNVPPEMKEIKFKQSLLDWISNKKGYEPKMTTCSIYGFYLGNITNPRMTLFTYNSSKVLKALCKHPRFLKNIALDLFPYLEGDDILTNKKLWPSISEFEIVPISVEQSTCNIWNSL